jgi:hypothetical protein
MSAHSRGLGNCVDAGLLLVGPPGVGKTYAVKAVQALCANTCKVTRLLPQFDCRRMVCVDPPSLLCFQVHIYEVNIPSLLCEPDPTLELDRIFQAVGKLRLHITSQKDPLADGDDSSVRLASPSTPGSGTLTSAPHSPSRATPSGTAAAMTPLTGTARAAGGFLSAGKTPVTNAKSRNNTFAYRSPAAMKATCTPQSSVPSTISSPTTVKGSTRSNSVAETDSGAARYEPEVAFVVVDEVSAVAVHLSATWFARRTLQQCLG